MVAIEHEKLRVQKEEASAKRMKEENKIMFKDVGGLDEIQISISPSNVFSNPCIKDRSKPKWKWT